MNDKFLIIKNMKLFILSLDNIVVNYPRCEYFMKDKLYRDSCEILELIYMANYTDKKEDKKKIQINILSKISMLDFYLERSYHNKYISEKQCCSKSNQLLTITKMVYGWIKNES